MVYSSGLAVKKSYHSILIDNIEDMSDLPRTTGRENDSTGAVACSGHRRFDRSPIRDGGEMRAEVVLQETNWFRTIEHSGDLNLMPSSI